MDKTKILELATDYVSRRSQMVLATNYKYPWIATVYYALGPDLSFYFLSDLTTIHAQHINLNPLVAITIADSPQLPSTKKKGVQISGSAQQITDEKEAREALDLWKEALHVTNSDYSYENMKADKIGSIFKITPQRVRFFNQEIWDEKDTPLLEL